MKSQLVEAWRMSNEANLYPLSDALAAFETPAAEFLQLFEGSMTVPNWKGPPATFLAYLAAHEAHHRGLAIVAIRVSGHKLPEAVIYGQWDGGRKRSSRESPE